jgi:class 3 adenylate cyclase/ligand-binding sensor domain-containing protein
MLKRIRLFLLASSILLSLSVFSQEGTPLITNFTFGETSIDNESWAMAQDSEGHMLFANRRGIVSFDGIKWNTILTPSAPLSLFFDDNSNQIFVGCKNNIGLLIKGADGIYQYASLVAGNRNVGDIESIASLNGDIYFYSSHYITRFNLTSKKIKQWPAHSGEPYTGFFINKADVYVNVSQLGLHKLKENIKVPVKGGDKLYGVDILFYLNYSKSQVLIGTSADSLYLFSGSKLHPYQYESSNYIKESILAGGINIDKNSFVLSTVTGGCLVINKATKKTTYTINYQTGLPDDEIYSMGIDQNKGLWLLHEYGMSRVDLKLPIRNVNHYPGLEGNLTSIIEVDSIIYVSTSEGVYYLTEVENYEEIEVLVKVNEVKKEKQEKGERIKQKKSFFGFIKRKNKEEEPVEVKEKKEKKENVWNKLFKRKKKKKKKSKYVEEQEESEPEEIVEEPLIEEEEGSVKNNERKDAPSNTASKYESKKVYALQSISHKYNKIEGLEGKAKQLLQYKDMLLVAANTGLYQIINNEATQVIANRYINFIYESKINPNKFYVSTNEGLIIIVNTNGNWVIEDKLNDFKENVYSVLELDKNNIWVGCENVAYNVLFDNAGYPVKIKPYTFKTDFTERILIRSIFNIPYFFLSTGLYSYNEKKDSIIYKKEINKGFEGQSKYIFSQKNITWVFNKLKWVSWHERSQYSNLPEEFLELFDDISNVYVDEENSLWIIDNNNSIYKILNIKKDYKEIFDVYLNFVVGKGGDLLPLENLQLNAENNSLKFNISAPYFVRSNAINFKYYIEGLGSEWSDWSQNHYIDLPYMPDGDFVLHIKAKNILGKETTVKKIMFSIEAPIYKKWWFYLFYLIGGVMLFWFILRLRERQLKRKQKILEDKITVRTEQLVKEQEKTESLILNILPKKVAEELKKFGKAKAKHYDYASVMFTDFKGFTFVAEKLTSADLVTEIDYCFSHFDDIVEKYNVEKIKTIGDAYMCAAGIPVEDSNNPILITLAGLEIAQFMDNHIKDRKAKDKPYFELRIGAHTGPLIAGVVGKKKFAYDIWGDTVNTAARLESSGEPGMVNVSEVTYKAIKDYFDCEVRGKIEAKNKGKIAMYFVMRINKKYSEDKDGKIPNAAFRKLINIEC